MCEEWSVNLLVSSELILGCNLEKLEKTPAELSNWDTVLLQLVETLSQHVATFSQQCRDAVHIFPKVVCVDED
ncbi:unnamed protein product, partial [Citrullus colocynthis]